MKRPRTSRNRLIAELALLFAYLLILLRFEGNFMANGDDGVMIFKSIRFAASGDLSLQAPVGHGVLPQILAGLFYWLHPSIYAIQLGIFGLILVAHFFVLRCGDALERPAVGWAGSAFFFLSPFAACFFQQRFWNVIYLIPFVAGSLYWAVAYARDRKPADLLLASLGLAIAAQAHYVSLVWAPTLVLLPFLFGSGTRPARSELAAVLLPLMLAHVPYLFWGDQPRTYVAGIAGLSLETALLLALGRDRMLRFLRPILLAGLAIGIFLIALNIPATSAHRELLKILPASNEFLSRAFRYTDWIPRLTAVLAPESLLFFAALLLGVARFPYLSPARKTLLLWSLLPFLLLSFHCLPGRGSYFAEHYWQPLFPGYQLLVVAFLLDPALTGRIRRAMAAACVALLLWNGYWFIVFSSHIDRSGGLSWHWSNVETKRRALTWIYGQASDPVLIFVADRAAGGALSFNNRFRMMGWRPFEEEVRGSYRSSVVPHSGTPIYYLTENEEFPEVSGISPSNLKRLHSLAGSTSWNSGPVRLYRASFLDETLGARLR